MEKIFHLPAPSGQGTTAFEVILAGITYPDPDYKVYRRSSEVFVVEYITDGEGTVNISGKEYSIKKGDAYILPMGKEHSYCSSRKNPWTKKWMNITGELCEKLIAAYGIENTVYFSNASIGEILEEFLDFCAHNTDINKINELGAVIFHRIVQRLAANMQKSIRTAATEIKKYIDANIYERLTAASVACSMGFSVSQLGRIFKAEYSTTVYSYILERKIDIAQNLLRNTTFSIKEISNMLYFTDEHYFCNIFKRKRNMTPGEYRKCYRH